MAVVRMEKTSNYTVISNYPLKDKNLSLKAIGLLCKMLSLPDGWEFSIAGLALICKENKGTVQTCLNELEDNGYVITRSERNKKGQFSKVEYTIYETPMDKEKAAKKKAEKCPDTVKPDAEEPYTENPDTVKPDTDNQPQLNTNQSNKKILNTHLSSIDSFLSTANAARSGSEKKRTGKSAEDHFVNLEAVKEQIGYDALVFDYPNDKEYIDELAMLISQVLSSESETIQLAKNKIPTQAVKQTFLTLDKENIIHVLDGLKQCGSNIRNIKQYVLTSLFNSASTINIDSFCKYNHDMWGGDV